MSIKSSVFDYIANTLMVPVVAAAGAFVLTLVLRPESIKPPSTRTPSNQRRAGEDHEDLDIAKAQALVEKLSSHVSVPVH
jgi:hypothetical protein